MGGLATGLKPLLQEEGDIWLKALTSSEGEIGKTKAGGLVGDMLKGYSEGMRRDSEALVQGTLQPVPKWRLFADQAYKQQRAAVGQRNVQSIRTANIIARDLNDQHWFGPDRVRLSQAIRLAEQQRNHVHAQNLADIASTFLREETPRTFYRGGAPTTWRQEAGVSRASPYKAPLEDSVETQFKKFSGFAYLGRVVIPHAFQNLNVMATEGFRPWIKSWAQFAGANSRADALDFAIKSGSMWEETYRDMLNIAEGRDTIWNKMFNMPGFSTTRKWEIIHAANAGKFQAQYAAEQFMKNQSKTSRLQLEMLGLDANRIATAGGLTQDDLLTAGYRSADENMFIEKGLKTPWTWDETTGFRMAALYKHFQFREGKLIKDALVRSFKSDPLTMLKTVGVIGVMFPLAGEMINVFDNLATGRPAFDRGHPLAEKFVEQPLESITGHKFVEGKPNVAPIAEKAGFHGRYARYTDEYFDALGHLAAFGIWYSMLRALMSGRGSDWMSGPVAGFGVDVAMGIYYSFIHRQFEPAFKRITRHIPVVGPAIAQQAKSAHRIAQKIKRKL